MKKVMCMRKNAIIPVMMFGICALGITACGNKEGSSTQEDTALDSMNYISINKDGSLESQIIETFEESYYNVDDLSTMINSSISDFKAANSEAEVSLKSCNTDNGSVKVVMSFDSYKSYSDFNGEIFYAGTIKDAYAAGMSLDVELSAISEKTQPQKIGKKNLLEMGDNHIVIFDQTNISDEVESDVIRIKCFGDILYVGDGVTPSGKKTADIAGDSNSKVIVFK